MFSFVRNCQTVYRSVCTSSHSHQQWRRLPVAPRSCQDLVLSVFLDFGHSIRCVVAFCCCFSLQYPSDIWCGASFYMCICRLSIFFDGVSCHVCGLFFYSFSLFSYWWVLRIYCIFWVKCRCIFCKYFLPIHDTFLFLHH